MNSLYLWFTKGMQKMFQNISVEQWLTYKWIVLAIAKAISSLSLLDKLKWGTFFPVKGKRGSPTESENGSWCFVWN